MNCLQTEKELRLDDACPLMTLGSIPYRPTWGERFHAQHRWMKQNTTKAQQAPAFARRLTTGACPGGRREILPTTKQIHFNMSVNLWLVVETQRSAVGLVWIHS